MAVIVLGEWMDFPIAAVRAHLREHAPQYRWQCGDRDEGGTSDKDAFDRPQLILGRTGGEIVMINAAQHKATYVGTAIVPPHSFHITLSNPTIDDPQLAGLLRYAICAGLIQNKNDDAIRCQLVPGGDWLDASAMRNSAPLIASGADMPNIDTVQNSAEQEARPQREAIMLAPLILLLADRIALDWAEIGGLIKELDPMGGWQVKCEPHCRGFLQGRGGMIALQNPDAPLAQQSVEEACTRSWWFDGDLADLAAHKSQLIISSTFEDDASPHDHAAAAKVISLIACVAAHHEAVAGVYHSGHGTIHNRGSVVDMLATIANNEIPALLWTARADALPKIAEAILPEPEPEPEPEPVAVAVPHISQRPFARAAGGFGRKGL